MMHNLVALLALPIGEIAVLAVICLIAGLVCSFSGFALSVIVMTPGALIITPVQLIPICWWLEISASLFMLRCD